MDKGRRNKLAQLKKEARIKKLKAGDLSERQAGQLKNHSTLCSCYICSHIKYKKPKYKNLDLTED